MIIISIYNNITSSTVHCIEHLRSSLKLSKVEMKDNNVYICIENSMVLIQIFLTD